MKPYHPSPREGRGFVPQAKYAHKTLPGIDGWQGCVLSALLTGLGVLCLLFPGHVHRCLPYVLGTLMAASGLSCLVRGLRTGEYRTAETRLTSSGIVVLAVGSTILLRGPGADGLIGTAWGIFGLVKGSELLNRAICAMANREPWLREMLHAAIGLLLAVVLLIDPVSRVREHVVLLGLELISIGVQLLLDLRPWKRGKKTSGA